MHILPNALTPLITLFPFLLMGAIASLAALDFLGFGLPPMTPSCGELLAEAQRRSFEIVKDRGGDETLAAQIGIGAVKYTDLSHDPITDIDFSWDKALALEGNSGPYLQYAYARVSSLLDKPEASAGDGTGTDFAVATPTEKRLALQLLEFPGAVVRAAEAYKPSVLADYLFQTAQLYSSFYQNSPILKSEEAVRNARLKLCSLFGEVLKTGLNLLGIETPRHI